MWFLTFVLPTNSYVSAKIRIFFRVVGRIVYTLQKTPKRQVNQTQPNQLSKSSPVPLCSHMLKVKQKEKK